MPAGLFILLWQRRSSTYTENACRALCFNNHAILYHNLHQEQELCSKFVLHREREPCSKFVL